MGTIQIDGSTPKLTIGNATAEDALILFDGNAQDFHIGLDDTADDLVIGVGSALGTTTALAIDENAGSTFSGTVTVGVDDTGKDVKLFGATSGSFLLWDESADALLLTDSTPIKIGDTQDLTLYHDGTNSYITNAVGALKIATETSGIAVTIGHTTSEVTIADNLTTTGTLTVGSTAINTNGGNLTAASNWRLTTDFDGDGDPISSNLEASDGTGQGNLGSAMSVSSGVFTFPSTGFWYVEYHHATDWETADASTIIRIKACTDGSTMEQAAIGFQSSNYVSATSYSTISISTILDVTNTSNVKCSFHVDGTQSNNTTKGSTDYDATTFKFIRLGDT